MTKLLALLIACLALGLSACGGDDSDDDGGGSSSGSAPTTESSGGGGGGGAASVDMKDIKFIPKELTVKAGTTVTWTNSDQVAHTVTGDDFDSGNVDPGGTFEQTFDKKGKFHYVCEIHPGQEGDVVVQ